METAGSTGRALARAGLVSLLLAGLIPSALCLVRKAATFGRADILLAPEGDGLRVHRVGPSATPSGLATGDLLLLVDGSGARASLEPAKLFAERAADVVLLRGGVTRRLTTAPVPAPWDLRYLFLFAVGGTFLASALAALRPVRPSKEALLYAAFALSVGLVLTLTPAPPLDGIFRVAVLAEDAARALFPAFLLALVLTFPRRARRVPAWLAFVPAAALLLATARVYFGPGTNAPADVAALDRAQIAWMAAGAALAAVRLVVVSRRPTDLLTEKQVRFLLLGTAVGILPLVVLNFVPRLLGGSIPILSTLALLPLALVPVAFLAALTRYRLWDVEALGREAASVTGALLLGAGFFAVAEMLLAHPLTLAVPHARGALQTSAGLLMALSFVPVRRGLSGAFRRFQYRHDPGDRDGLLALLRDLPSPRPLAELTDLLVSRVARGLGAPRAALLGVTGDVADGSPVDGGGALALSELPAAARLRTTRLSRQEFTERPTAAVARLRRAGFRTLAPLTVSGRLLALFAVADRGGRVPLSAEDAELLETVLAPAALALDHARLFEELRAQADRYRNLQEFHENVVAGSAAAIAATNGEGRFTSVNPAFAALVGRTAASLLGCRATEILPPAVYAAFSAANPPARLEADLGAGARVLNVAVSPFPGAPAGSSARVLVLVDATETARLEKALADRERLNALGTLSAGVAHEVNTPLAGVAGFARLLLDETPGDDPRRALVEKIERQAFRASRLVGSLLDLARGRPREIEPLDPADVAREAARALEDEGAARGASVRLVIAGRTPAVAGHRDALVQVLVNLVKNGIEAATAPGDARPASPEVVLAVSAGDGSVRFDVTDNGPGLASADAARVFEPFYSTKTAQGGTGLGLSMARDIIRAHGGTLTAASGSSGARFTVTLPAAT